MCTTVDSSISTDRYRRFQWRENVKINKKQRSEKAFRWLFFTNVRPFAHVSENQMCIAACNNSLRAMYGSMDRGLDLHMCSPSSQISGPEFTSTRTVGVQIKRTQRSATLRFTRKMFVLFRMSLPRNTTIGT